MASNESDKQWAQEQIAAYGQVYPRYANMAQVLQKILEKAARQSAPLAIIQTRPKAIPASPRRPSARRRSAAMMPR